MDFRDLTYVLGINHYQTITDAAKALYISQPALSRFLHNLEETIGLQLFERQSQKYIPTHAGERYIAYAKQIMELKDALDIELLEMRRANIGKLSVVFPQTRGSFIIPEALPIFRKEYPNIELNIIDKPSSNFEDLVKAREVDIAFFNLPLKDPHLSTVIVSKDEFVLVLPKTHPCAHGISKSRNYRYPYLDMRLLKEDTFILPRPSQRSRSVINALFQERSFCPKSILETRDIMMILRLVAKGEGVSIMNNCYFEHIRDDSLVCFSCAMPPVEQFFAACYRPQTILSPYAKRFIEIVSQLA